MKISTSSCSALAQKGWNFGSDNSSPLTLPPISAPRNPSCLAAYSSWSAARSECCRATDASPTNRSGCAAQISASLSGEVRLGLVPKDWVDAERLNINALLIHCPDALRRDRER